jgi:hypothetical protein
MERIIYPPATNVLTLIPIQETGANLYGVELEIEFPSAEQRDAFPVLFYAEPRTYAILVREPSIINGIEIVTTAASIERMTEMITYIVQLCQHGGAVVSDRTGLHIHMSREGDTNTLDALGIFRFINNPAHREEIISFAGRISEYARYSTHPAPRNRSRGYSVNILPPTTVEFRLFSSQINVEWIMGCVWFCALIRRIPSSFRDLVTYSQTRGDVPDYVIRRLMSVRQTPRGSRYPPIVPIPSMPQWW